VRLLTRIYLTARPRDKQSLKGLTMSQIPSRETTKTLALINLDTWGQDWLKPLKTKARTTGPQSDALVFGMVH
jgi:hypothetical protein